MSTLQRNTDVNAVMHAVNVIVMTLFYLICRYLLRREVAPPPDEMEQPTHGKFRLPDPEYEKGATVHFLGVMCCLSIAPSAFYCLFYAIFSGLCEGDETRADIPSQYNKNAYLRQQWIISGLTVAHVLFRYLAHCDTKARHDHGEACVTQMRLKGHERVLVVRCGMGQWTSAIAHAMVRGGKVTGVDDWLTKECPMDAEWAVENTRREGLESKVMIETEPKDVGSLDMKDECVDVVVIPYDEEGNEPRYFQMICEMNRVLKPGGKLVAVQPFVEPTILEDILEEMKYTKTRRAYVRTGYNMNKVIVGTKPENVGLLHAHDGEAAQVGISLVDSDYLNESPGMAGVGLHVMLFLMTLVGLYGIVLLNIFLYMEWEEMDYPKHYKVHNRLGGGFFVNLSIWWGYAITAVWFELRQRSKFTIRRVGVVKMYLLYCLQYLGGALTWVILSYAVKLWLREYSLTIQVVVSWVMILPTGVAVYILAKIRIFETMTSWRPQFGVRPEGAPSRLKQFMESDEFNMFMMGTIILAGALVGCSTSETLAEDELFKTLQHLVLIIFIIECVVKLVADIPKPWLYFYDYWNIFDFSIVLVGVLGLIFPIGGSFVLVVRLFRLARVFKMFKQIQQLRIVVSTLFVVLPAIGWILLVMSLLLYVFGCMGAVLFGQNDPVFFGNLGKAMISVMPIMTKRWHEYFEIEFYGCKEYYPETAPNYVADCTKNTPQPFFALIYFIPVIMLMSYIFCNLMIGMVIMLIEPATAEVKREDWEAAEAFEEGAGGDPGPEVKALLSRLETRKVLKQLVAEAKAYRQDVKRLRRMILYIRPKANQMQAMV